MSVAKFLKFLEKESLREVYFLTVALILAFGVLQTTGSILETEKPVVSVVSCSMYPELHVGDILVVKGTEFSEIEQGDVIVYTVQRAELEIGGENYTLTKYNGGSKVETPVGEMEIVTVMTDRRTGEAMEAVVEIDGERVRLREGDSYSVEGSRIEVKQVVGMDIPVVHRVVGKEADSLETRGDNNMAQLDFEKSVEPDQIHGRLLFSIPRIGGLKILVMDLVGFGEDRPLVVDAYPQCDIRVPLDER